MKSLIDHQKYYVTIAFLLTVLSATILPAAEILHEQGWTRIISGDRATSLTREIGEQAQPTEISENTIKLILQATGLSLQTPTQIKAWQSGLKKYGWAQQENEPEYAPYQAIQMVIINEDGKLKILSRNYNHYGKTLEAYFDIKGKQLSYKKINIPETLDRTVFHTVRSPALFVLNQEHFQKHFFEGMLNLDYPGLGKAKQAYQNKKILLAAHEVAEYFRRKMHPIWPSEKPKNLNDTDEAAEKVLHHEFKYHDSTIYLGKRMDFRNNPTQDNEWIWGLNRMGHWLTLLTGYLKTSNEAYAREYNSQVIDWTVRNPAPPFRLTRVPSWRNLEAGVRMSSTWPKSFFGFLISPSFQTQAIQLMLASMWSHGEHIMKFPSGLRFVNNWVIIGSNGLANLGMFFPEFLNARIWSETGLKRLSEQLAKQVYPDGMQHELSTGYHLACMHSFYQAFETAQKTGTSLPDNYRNTMEKMFEYIMYVSTPSRQVPPTNDANRHDITSWMQKGADLFKRKDMRFVATNGQEGDVPERTSIQFPWGGHCVMRSDWSPQGWYLFFDAGPTGVSHQHEDKLHMGISAFGRDFLTDGGKGLYIPDKWRSYFLSSQAHNTIIIDGQGQNRIADVTTHRAEAPMKNRWISGENIDFASGTYDNGYGPQKIAVTHSRYIVFKKKDYWLVLDYLTGEGQHSFEALYHFTPCEVQFDENINSVKTLFKDGRNIRITSSATLPLSSKMIEGQENPEQGWIYQQGHRMATPTAIFAGRGQLPVLMATVIEPVKDNSFIDYKIKIDSKPTHQAEIKILSNRGEDHWRINLENQNRIFIDGEEKPTCIQFVRIKDGNIEEKFDAKF